MARGQASDKLVLVQHKPGVGIQVRITMILIGLTAAIIGFFAGQWFSNQKASDLEVAMSDLYQQYNKVEAEASILRQQVADLESGAEIDKIAQNHIHNAMTDLQSEVSRLEHDLAFYKGIMAPSENAKGLQVTRVSLQPGASPEKFVYEIVLAKLADNKRFIGGNIKVSIHGKQDGQALVLDLKDLLDRDIKQNWNFKFRYFQDFEGELSLPDNFEADFINVVATAKGNSKAKVEHRVTWLEALASAP